MKVVTKPIVRLLTGALLAPLTYLTGAATNPSLAGAHCGDHAGSCETGRLVAGYCGGECGDYFTDVYEVYDSNCSGTCYNGGTAGCCESPEACSDAPCKPGGCDYQPCNYRYSYYICSDWTCGG